MPIVGVPKTIDNDLSCTQATFGFDTAVTVATEAIDRLHTTAESHERIMVVEVMGRYAGWIAMHAGVAGNAHVILLPEIPYDIDTRRRAHQEALRRAAGATASSSSPRAPSPRTATSAPSAPSSGARCASAAWPRRSATTSASAPASRSRSLVLGHLQRGGSPTHRDRLLALRFGAAAVRMVEQGKFGHIVAYHPPHMVPVPIEEAIARHEDRAARLRHRPDRPRPRHLPRRLASAARLPVLRR